MHKLMANIHTTLAMFYGLILTTLLTWIEEMSVYFRFVTTITTAAVGIVLIWHWLEKVFLTRQERKHKEFEHLRDQEAWEIEKMKRINNNGTTVNKG